MSTNSYGVRVSWEAFKVYLDAGISLNEVVLPGSLRLIAIDGDSKFQCIIHTDGDMSAEYAEYQANYEVLKTINQVVPELKGLNSKYRIDASSTKVDLPDLFETPVEIYKYDGAGRLLAITMKFNSDNVMIKLSVDSEEIFHINCGNLENLAASNGDGYEIPIINWSRTKNMLIFKPLYPIHYKYQVQIECTSNSSSNARDMQQYHVHLTKDK